MRNLIYGNSIKLIYYWYNIKYIIIFITYAFSYLILTIMKYALYLSPIL